MTGLRYGVLNGHEVLKDAVRLTCGDAKSHLKASVWGRLSWALSLLLFLLFPLFQARSRLFFQNVVSAIMVSLGKNVTCYRAHKKHMLMIFRLSCSFLLVQVWLGSSSGGDFLIQCRNWGRTWLQPQMSRNFLLSIEIAQGQSSLDVLARTTFQLHHQSTR